MGDRDRFFASLEGRFGKDRDGRFNIRDGEDVIGSAEIRPWGDAGVHVAHIGIDKDGRRRRGVGTRFMTEVSEIAAEHGTDIHLYAFWRPDFEDGGWLIRWYSGLGFETDGDLDEEGYAEMTRIARPSPSPSP